MALSPEANRYRIFSVITALVMGVVSMVLIGIYKEYQQDWAIVLLFIISGFLLYLRAKLWKTIWKG
ncbi:hypothetical protein KBTX_03694 [wastewater metagenome]|uniref:Uncharacterized protein n=2 Tax=unclassified sequences TaxID=12908 RepID=A0A5B8RJR4_9ZZZZ|nr:hypothetical protein [Arhodomonas sp. KWT]QEA07345.1 hypothetical protein KBTEX_03694 [uncultured organism]